MEIIYYVTELNGVTGTFSNYSTILSLFNKWKKSDVLDYDTAVKMDIADFCNYPTGSDEWEDGFRPLVNFCKRNNIQLDWEDFI